eukprot:1338568-Pyramimonas_sp.AAC.1
MGGFPAALLKPCQERLHACLHACRQARVDACRSRSRRGCRGGRFAAADGDRRGGAPGRHHHRLASNLKPSSSQGAPRETSCNPRRNSSSSPLPRSST